MTEEKQPQVEENQEETQEQEPLNVSWWVGPTNKIMLSLKTIPFTLEFPADATTDHLLLFSLALQDVANDIKKKQVNDQESASGSEEVEKTEN